MLVLTKANYISTIDCFNFMCDNETSFIAMKNGDVYINTKDWDIDFEYEEIKGKRKVVVIKFLIKSSKKL